MDPNAVYYLVVGGGAALAGVVLDVVGDIPWWTVAALGLVGAWAFTWLTALDDVRRPFRSVRILVAMLRDPFAMTRTRAAIYEIPLYVPATDWQGTRWLSGGGLSFGGNLLSPARPSATVTWTGSGATLSVRTATRPTGTSRSAGRLPRGISHQLALVEDDSGLADVTARALVAQLRPVTFAVDGVPLTGTVLDLSPWGRGWIAEARLDDQFVVELAGEGVAPDGLPLVTVTVQDIPVAPEA